MPSTTRAGRLLATANSFAELHSIATLHQLRGPLQRPLRLLWERGYIDEAAATALRSAMPHAGSSPLQALLTSQEIQRELKRRAASEVRRAILRGAVCLLEQPDLAVVPGGALEPVEAAGSADEVPLDEVGLEEWAQAWGIVEALDAPAAEVLGAAVDGSFEPRETIWEVIAPGDDAFLGFPWRRAEPAPRRAAVQAAREWLLLQRDEARRAVEEERSRPPASPPPGWEGLFSALAEWRQGARRSVWPTTREVRARGGLEFRSEPPGFAYQDPRPIVCGRPPHRADVFIGIEALDQGRVTVACHACESLGGPGGCRHALAAADALADFASGPTTGVHAAIARRLGRPALAAADALADFASGPTTGVHAAIARRLGRPAWERTAELLRVAAGAAGEEEEPGGPSRRLIWRVELSEHVGLRVRAVMQKALKRGGWSPGSPLRQDAVMQDDAVSSPADRLAAALTASSSGDAWGDRAWLVLSALVGAGNVVLGSESSVPVRVELAELGLCCRASGDGFELLPAAGGAPFEVGAWAWREGEQLRRFMAHHDAARGRLLLVRASARSAGVLQLLRRRGSRFPAEAAEALAEELSSLALPVVLPEALLGRECAPDPRVLVTARMEGLSLGLEALARPLPEGVTFPAGGGPEQVRGKRDGERVFARRSLEQEARAAESLWQSLGLARAEGASGVTARVDGLEALACLQRLEEAERAGLEVIWPPARPTFARAVRASDLRVKVHGARFWFGLSGEAEVDGERVALAALLDAARRRERFVKLAENRWAELGEELLRKVGPLADLAVAGERGPEVTVAAAPALEALAPELGALEPAPAFRELLGRLRAARAAAPAVPSELRASRPYQREGFEWLARLSAWAPGACLADDMGLGKTLQALALLLHRRGEGPALVVAPTLVCFNWEAEAGRFAPSLRVISWHRCDRAAALSGLRGGDVLVVSYALLARDAEALKAARFGTVVLDEAQNIKNAEALRSRAARELQAGFCLALTGTPLENHLGELWSLYRAVFPGLLGSQAQFRERFQLGIERDGDAARRQALSAILRPFLLRRTKREVATELPPRTEVTVPVALTDAEQRLYDEARLAAVAELGGGEGGERKDRRFQVLAALTRLRLLACHPRLHDERWEGPASKLERFLELVDELRDEGHRALVFSQFTRHLGVVREALDARSVSYQYLDGSTPVAERRGRVEAFQRGEGDLFLISLKAGGSGLNLTAADHVIHLDPWWNPAVEDQATDRAHRIGQTRPVTVFRLVARGTIEEQILSLHGEKRALLSGVLEGTGSAAPVDMEELVSMLSSGGVEGVERGGGNVLSGFARFLQREVEEGRFGERSIKAYLRAATRLAGFLEAAGKKFPASVEEVEAIAPWYLERLRSGEFAAPASEPGLAAVVMKKLAGWLRG